MKFVLIIIFIFSTILFYSQLDSDLNRILAHDHIDTTILKQRKTSYVFKNNNWFVKYNPLSLVFGGSLLFYQKVISPQIMMGCAFNPSCSNFSKECVKEYGIVKGVALSTDRLTRCTRLSAIDFHPVMFNKNGKVDDLPVYYHLHP